MNSVAVLDSGGSVFLLRIALALSGGLNTKMKCIFRLGRSFFFS